MFPIAYLTASALALACAGGGGDAASEILALERAALDRSDRGDPGGFLDLSDPDVVYLDPYLEKPIYGLAALRDFYRSFGEGETGRGEIQHPKVQVWGDTAVLTFRYVSTSDRSRRVTRWHTTEVYRRTGGQWRIVHTHWSLLKEQP